MRKLPSKLLEQLSCGKGFFSKQTTVCDKELYINIWERHKGYFIFLVNISHPDYTCDFALYKLLAVFAVAVIYLMSL